MPSYIVQRAFPQGLEIPVDEGGTDVCRAVIDRGAEHGVGGQSFGAQRDGRYREETYRDLRRYETTPLPSHSTRTKIRWPRCSWRPDVPKSNRAPRCGERIRWGRKRPNHGRK